MSSSHELSEILRRKVVRPSEKSNFSQTCNLLSNYLKKKGSFGDLFSMGLVSSSNPQSQQGEPEACHQTLTTMNLLPNLEISSETSSVSEESVAENRNFSSMDLFPQHEKEAPSSQMTIFYAGKVFVFNDFAADKAREVMSLASSNSVSTTSNDQFNQNTFATSNSLQDCFQRPARANIADLPIARKASLHLFLEKRKHRISAKAPYFLNSAPKSFKQEADHSKNWLDLAASSDAVLSKQLDLQL